MPNSSDRPNPPPARGRGGRAAWLAGLAMVLSACGAVPAPPDAQRQVWNDSAFAPVVATPTRQEIFALTPEMKAFLAGPVQNATRTRGAARGLVEALMVDGRVRIEYDASRTRTASETFAEQAGNCLSLVVMTAAMARELGLAVRFQDMDQYVWERREGTGLDLRIGHVNVLLGRPEGVQRDRGLTSWLMIDFLSSPDAHLSPGQPIEESRVVAMVLNNRAGEALLRQDTRTAYWHARAALAADAGLAHAWNTLGIVHARQGDPARAELAYRLAIQHDVRHEAAMGNLADVLRQTGRPLEADEWLARQRQLLPEHPLALVADGLQALEAGDLGRARRLLERALPLTGGSHELHFALARTYAAMGDRRRTEQQLELAREAGDTPQARARYAAKLSRLRPPAPTP